MSLTDSAARAFRIAHRELAFSPGATAAALSGRAASLYWARDASTSRNFGDAINPALARFLLDKPVVHANDVFAFGPWSTLYLVGSILDNLTRPNAVVFGSGFKSAGATIRRRPRAVLAVRGPLTRRKLLDMGIDCPEVYCDPGLLVPEILRERGGLERVDVGLIPHFVDRAQLKDREMVDGGMSCRVIDIEGEASEVVRQITSCDCIVSSSLHGLITAHAYGIRATWAKFSDKVGGDGFKFRDYYASVSVSNPEVYDAATKLDLRAVVDMATCPDSAGNVSALLGQAGGLRRFF